MPLEAAWRLACRGGWLICVILSEFLSDFFRADERSVIRRMRGAIRRKAFHFSALRVLGALGSVLLKVGNC